MSCKPERYEVKVGSRKEYEVHRAHPVNGLYGKCKGFRLIRLRNVDDLRFGCAVLRKMQMNRALRYVRTPGNGDRTGTPFPKVECAKGKVHVVGDAVDAVFGYVIGVAACILKLVHADFGPRLVDSLEDEAVQ